MNWFRTYHGFTTDPKWRVVANRAKSTPANVMATVLYFLERASCNAVKRGVTQGFVTPEIAVTLGVSEEETQRIIDNLILIGFMTEGEISNWNDRQPRREDNSTERVKAHRQRKKAARETGESNAGETQGNAGVTGETQRNADVTQGNARGEEKREESTTLDAREPRALLEECFEAAGFDCDDIWPTGWMPPKAGIVCQRWVSELGLDKAQVIEVIRSEQPRKARNPTYFDGRMKDLADEIAKPKDGAKDDKRKDARDRAIESILGREGNDH